MDPFDFGFGENLGGAADYGTGFGQPFTQTPGVNQPMMPWTGGFPGQDLGDPAASFAAGLAARGIRPQQFLQNPQAAARSMAPALPPPMQNDWDPTPVATPGGAAVTLPGRGATVTPSDASVTLNVDPAKPAGEAAEASAAAKPEDKGGDMAKRITDALRGVRMPTPPQPQTIRTPQAPQPHAVNAIKGGQLLALLQSLGVNPAAAKIPALGGMLRG
jgi:hypothetical protein